MKIYLTVVIPCYNEENNLKAGVLKQVDDFLAKQNYLSEVIVSDDESTDNSRQLVTEFVKKHPRFRLLKNKHGGKAYAVRAGIEHAKGEIVLFTDMDQSTPIEEIDKILPFFRQGYDVVIGSRGMTRKNFPWYRQVMSWGFYNFRRLIVLPDIIDTQCGFKSLKTKVAGDLFPLLSVFKKTEASRGWKVGAFDVELLFLAEKKGFKIKEVKVVWQNQDLSQGKKQKFFKESQEMFKEILRVKVNDLKNQYQ